jgi:hypothetical protein
MDAGTAPRINLTRYQGALAPNYHWCEEVTLARPAKARQKVAMPELETPTERHVPIKKPQGMVAVRNRSTINK